MNNGGNLYNKLHNQLVIVSNQNMITHAKNALRFNSCTVQVPHTRDISVYFSSCDYILVVHSFQLIILLIVDCDN